MVRCFTEDKAVLAVDRQDCLQLSAGSFYNIHSLSALLGTPYHVITGNAIFHREPAVTQWFGEQDNDVIHVP